MEPYDGGTPEMFMIAVASTMLFPNDEDARSTWALGNIGHDLQHTAAREGYDAIAPVLRHQSIWRAMLKSSELSGLEDAASAGARDGRIAGAILHVVLMLERHMNRLASINNAVRVVMQDCDLGRSSILGAWGRSKAVSALWAAHLYGPYPFPVETLDEEVFELFLADAEAYRRAGEAKFAKGSTATFLEPGAQPAFWVRPTTLDFPSLDPWIASAVGSH